MRGTVMLLRLGSKSPSATAVRPTAKTELQPARNRELSRKAQEPLSKVPNVPVSWRASGSFWAMP
jgi:hypothetical protein